MVHVWVVVVNIQGDSGGPLACKDHQDRWTVIGVNSYITSKCQGLSYVTRVSSFVDWIHETMTSE